MKGSSTYWWSTRGSRELQLQVLMVNGMLFLTWRWYVVAKPRTGFPVGSLGIEKSRFMPFNKVVLGILLNNAAGSLTIDSRSYQVLSADINQHIQLRYCSYPKFRYPRLGPIRVLATEAPGPPHYDFPRSLHWLRWSLICHAWTISNHMCRGYDGKCDGTFDNSGQGRVSSTVRSGTSRIAMWLCRTLSLPLAGIYNPSLNSLQVLPQPGGSELLKVRVLE